VSTIPSPTTLRNASRRLDRRNAGVATVLKAMRDGQALHVEYFPTGPKWRMSAGRYVKDEVARVVINNEQVVGVGDTLFADGTPQTWLFAETESFNHQERNHAYGIKAKT
jgi:hypothetical protein